MILFMDTRELFVARNINNLLYLSFKWLININIEIDGPR